MGTAIDIIWGYLIKNNRKSQTIKSYISAIKAVLKDNNIRLREDVYLLASLTKVCRIHNDRLKSKLPIHKSLLHCVLQKIDSYYVENNQPYLSVLFKAIFITGYYGLLRVSELVGIHAVKAVDVYIRENKSKFMLILRTSKTHGLGDKPQIIKLSSAIQRDDMVKSSFCPFQKLNSYVESCPSCRNINERFFVFCDRSSIPPIQLVCTLNISFLHLNLDPKAYSLHGLCAGRASDLLNYGVSVETIKKLGRWKSNAVYTYLRC